MGTGQNCRLIQSTVLFNVRSMKNQCAPALLSALCLFSVFFTVGSNAAEQYPCSFLFHDIVLQSEDTNKTGKWVTGKLEYGEFQDTRDIAVAECSQTIELKGTKDQSQRISIAIRYTILPDAQQATLWCFNSASNRTAIAESYFLLHTEVRRGMGLSYGEIALEGPVNNQDKWVDDSLFFQCNNVSVRISVSSILHTAEKRRIGREFSQLIIERIRKSKELEKIRKSDYSFLPKEVEERLKKRD
jgi:hypothetical protein